MCQLRRLLPVNALYIDIVEVEIRDAGTVRGEFCVHQGRRLLARSYLAQLCVRKVQQPVVCQRFIAAELDGIGCYQRKAPILGPAVVLDLDRCIGTIVASRDNTKLVQSSLIPHIYISNTAKKALAKLANCCRTNTKSYLLPLPPA